MLINSTAKCFLFKLKLQTMSVSNSPVFDCPRGVPDCDPPTKLYILFSTIAMLILLYISDMAFYTIFDETFSDASMRETPLFLNLLVGYLIASVVFTITYIYYGRPPRYSETEHNYRSRTQKGLLYGFSVGSLIFIPTTFIMSSVVIDYNLGLNLLDGIYHTLQLTIGGVIIAHILGTPAKT